MHVLRSDRSSGVWSHGEDRIHVYVGEDHSTLFVVCVCVYVLCVRVCVFVYVCVCIRVFACMLQSFEQYTYTYVHTYVFTYIRHYWSHHFGIN